MLVQRVVRALDVVRHAGVDVLVETPQLLLTLLEFVSIELDGAFVLLLRHG